MYGHMHSTSTTSTVQLLETLGRRQSAMSKKQKVVHIHSSTCRPVKMIAEPECEAFESTEDAVTWWSGPGLLCQGCFGSAAAPQPEAPGGDSWNKHNTQEVNLYFCALSPRLTQHANICQKMLCFSLWVLPAADRSRCLRLPRQAPAVRPRPLVAVPRHAQAPLDREGVAD